MAKEIVNFVEGRDHPCTTHDEFACLQCNAGLSRRRFAQGAPKKYCSAKCTQLACRIRRAKRNGKKYIPQEKSGRPVKK